MRQSLLAEGCVVEHGKARAAIKEERLKGRHLGKAPLGYRNVVINGKPAIAIDPDTAPLVKEAFRLASQKKMSLRKILEELDRLGLRTKAGRKLSVSSLHKILSNPFYIGIVRCDHSETRGRHTPLIDRKAFDFLQKTRR